MTRSFALSQAEGSRAWAVDSDGGRFEVTTPSNWQMLELTQGPVLQVGNHFGKSYVLVLSESKNDFDGLDDYSAAALQMFQGDLASPSSSGLIRTIVGGMAAVQFEISERTEEMDLTYLVTCIAGPRSFYRVVAWPIPGWDESISDLRRATESVSTLPDKAIM